MVAINTIRDERYSEEFFLSDTRNCIDLIYVRGGSAIYDQSRPIALELPVGDGTVDSYLVRAGATDYEESLTSLRHILDGNLDFDKPLSSKLELFLSLFVKGQ